MKKFRIKISGEIILSPLDIFFNKERKELTDNCTLQQFEERLKWLFGYPDEGNPIDIQEMLEYFSTSNKEELQINIEEIKND